MATDLDTLLGLVGQLRDEPGEDTARERFRNYLREEVSDVGVLQDYVQVCLQKSEPQYHRALQDLINRTGELLGFQVAYGRYSGTSGEVGFDGHWTSLSGSHIVVEVKTTEVYAIRTSALLGYINDLVSAQKIAPDAPRLGLYVVGKPDSDLNQLENAVRAEGHLQDLRVVSSDSLLALTGLKQEYDVPHSAVVEVLFPSGPRVDPTVDLMAKLVAEAEEEERTATPERQAAPAAEPSEGANYYLTPINWKGEDSPMAAVGSLLNANKYAFSERAPHRRHFKAGDWLAFYGSGYGVFARARMTDAPRHEPLPEITRDAEEYPWTVDLDSLTVHEDDPVVLDREMREKMDAFEGRDPGGNWGWLVQTNFLLTEHDFRLLTRQEKGP